MQVICGGFSGRDKSGPESPRKMQDEQEVMSETSGNATRRRGEDGWRLETETLETNVFWNGGGRVSTWTSMVNVTMSREQVKSSRRESETPGEEGEEVKSPNRKVIPVESEETQDFVRKAKDTKAVFRCGQPVQRTDP